MKRVLLVFAALLATLPASAGIHYRTGVFIGPAYGPWGWYGPYAPYYGYPVAVHRNAGQVKIDTKEKNAQVFLNGAYAGSVKEVNSMWLRPGKYDLEIRSAEGATFDSQIFVVNGKTMHIKPDRS